MKSAKAICTAHLTVAILPRHRLWRVPGSTTAVLQFLWSYCGISRISVESPGGVQCGFTSTPATRICRRGPRVGKRHLTASASLYTNWRTAIERAGGAEIGPDGAGVGAGWGRESRSCCLGSVNTTGVDGVVSENPARRGGVRRVWRFQAQGRQRSMAGFSPQPEGTGPFFPISLSFVAPVIHYSSLLTSRTRENRLPSPPSQ